jgi:hypothetical protein
MKNFSLANINNYHLIQQELANQFLDIIQSPNIDEANDLLKKGIKTYPGNVSETVTPEFYKFIQSLNYGKILNMTFWVTGMFSKNKAHIDGTSKFVPKIKLIMPVFNCEGTTTKWFDYQGEIDFVTIRNLELFVPNDEKLLIETDSLEMTNPIWARVDRIHTIMNPRLQIRVACSIIFEDQDQLEKDFLKSVI